MFEKAFHYFSLRREEYLKHYHRRSNVESVFSIVKRKFGDSVRAKSDVAMKNEALCKLLAHNLCCVIAAWYELGIEPLFMPAESAKDEERVRFSGSLVEHPAPKFGRLHFYSDERILKGAKPVLRAQNETFYAESSIAVSQNRTEARCGKIEQRESKQTDGIYRFPKYPRKKDLRQAV